MLYTDDYVFNKFCRGCADCCIGTYAAVTEKEIKRIEGKEGIERDEFSEFFLASEKTGSGYFLLKRLPDGRCHFLDEERECRIYHIRPEKCRQHYCAEISVTMRALLDSGLIEIRDTEELIKKYGKPRTRKDIICKISERTRKIKLRDEHRIKRLTKNQKLETLHDSVEEVTVSKNAKDFYPELYDPGRAANIRKMNSKYRKEVLGGFL